MIALKKMKHYSLFLLSFILFLITNYQLLAQGETCGAATPLAIGTCNTAYNFTSAVGNELGGSITGCGAFTPQGDVWSTFTAPSSGQITVQYTSTSGQDISLAAYNATCAAGGLLQCSNTQVGNGTETITFPVTAGLTYNIRFINHTNTALVNGSVCIYIGNRVATDSYTNAQNLTIGTCDFPISAPSTAINDEANLFPFPGCAGATSKDAWVKFTANATELFGIEFTSFGRDAAIALYREVAGLPVLVATTVPLAGGCIDQNDPGPNDVEFLEITVPTAGTYFVRILDLDASAGALDGNLCIYTVYGRDACTDLTATTPVILVGENSCGLKVNVLRGNAVNIGGGGACDFSFVGANVRDEWVIFQGNGLPVILQYESITPLVNPYLAIYQRVAAPDGTCALGEGDLVPIGPTNCQTAGGNPFVQVGNTAAGQPIFNTTAGTYYYVRIGGDLAGTDMRGVLCLQNLNPAPATNCDVATNLGTLVANSSFCGVDVNFDLISYTQPIGGPAGSCAVPVAPPNYADAWYRVDVAAGLNFTVQFDNNNNDPTTPNDVSVVIYTGVPTGICGGLTEVGCVNTLVEGLESINLTNPGGLQTFYLRINTNTTTEQRTSGRLCVFSGTVQGDVCNTAFPLLVGDCDVDVDIDGTFISNQPIPNPPCGSSFKDGWYQFTATSSLTTIEFAQNASPTQNAVIAIYRGSCGTPFYIDCADAIPVNTAGIERIKLPTIVGLRYYVRIYNDNSANQITGRLCVVNTPERDVCDDNDLVTRLVGDCNIPMDVPASFSDPGPEYRDFELADEATGNLPVTENNGSLTQLVHTTCETTARGVSPYFNPNTPGPFNGSNTNPSRATSKDAWIRVIGNGSVVTITYQNREASSDPSLAVYTALKSRGPVNCGVGLDGAGFVGNQFGCANNTLGAGLQTEAVTFQSNAGQIYLLRLLDLSGTGMTGILCISEGFQQYEDPCLSNARTVEVGDCNVPLNVISGLASCHLPAAGAPYNDPACTFDDCAIGQGDSWARFTIPATLADSRITVRYDNRDGLLTTATNVQMVIYREGVGFDCNNPATYVRIGCQDNVGEGVEEFTITPIASGENYLVRIINTSTSSSALGNICVSWGQSLASPLCPGPINDYGTLEGEFKPFEVLNTAPYTSTNNQPTATIPDCVLPGGSNPASNSPNPVRADAWMTFTVSQAAVLGGQTSFTVQYDNTGVPSPQNAAVAVYVAPNHPNGGGSVNCAALYASCSTCPIIDPNGLFLLGCTNSVFQGNEALTISIPDIDNPARGGTAKDRVYYVRVMNVSPGSGTPNNMPGRIRVFPFAPCNVGAELVRDGNFAGWPGINGVPGGIADNQTAGTTAIFDAAQDPDIHSVPPNALGTNNPYPNALDNLARFATDYGYVRDQVTDGTRPVTDTYRRYYNGNQYELNPEGLFTVRQTPWTVKGDWFCYGNGYSGYGGRLGGGRPVRTYCATGAGGNGLEPCTEVQYGSGGLTSGRFAPENGVGGIERPREVPTTSDANFMIINGSFDPNSGLPPGKVWCQTIQRPGGSVGYYVFTAWSQNMISGGRNLDVPLLRMSVCDMDSPTNLNPNTAVLPGSPSGRDIDPVLGGVQPTFLPGVTLGGGGATYHDPIPPVNRIRDPRLTTQYGAAMPCNTGAESRDARLKVLGSSFLITENPDNWVVVRCIYKAKDNITEFNACIENLSLTKNGNDFGLDDISFRQCLSPDVTNFERLLKGDPCELSNAPEALGIPLNTSMVDFTGKLIGTNVFLDWMTLEERNAGYFMVERSLDGGNFKSIGKVDAKVKNFSTYNFIDKNIPKGLKYLYYRLKIFDTNGVDKQGPVIQVDVSSLENPQTLVVPNPVKSGENAELRFMSGEGRAVISVYDLMGNRMSAETISTTNGTNTVLISTKGFGKGIYIVKIAGSGGISTAVRMVVL